ncbi:MAG: vitamin K epoxide reductase family protein, partial [Nanoarchaeota archaeon]
LVNSSPYAELFGVPVALWGIFFYLFIFALAGFVLWKKEKEHKEVRIATVILHASAIWSVLFSIYLFYVAKFIIGALCPYCIMMYGVNLGLFIATKVASGMTYSEMRHIIILFFTKKENK